jgi:membrane associated rhomboid family serine protease
MPDLPQRRRSAPPSWTDRIVERLTPAVKVFVIVIALLYAFYVFVRDARPLIETHLALGPRLFAGEVWQPITSLFVELNPLGFVFNVIGLWSIGASMERMQGTRRFLLLFFISGVLANLAIAGVYYLLRIAPVYYDDGCWFPVLAMLVAFGASLGRSQVQLWGGLFLQARTVAIIFLVWSIVAHAARKEWGHIAGALVASLVGLVAGTAGGVGGLWANLRARRLRRRYQVLEGGAGRPAKKRYLN